MNKRIGEFVKELFGDRKFSYIYDYENNMIYFRPQEVFANCELKEQTIRAKIMKIPGTHKKFFTNKMLKSGDFDVDLKSTTNNTGENWVTIYGMIKALQGKNKKANEIVDWLIFEVLPQIMEKGAYIDENATAEQLLEVKKEIDEKVGQARLEERNRRAFTAKQICKLIHVPNLRYETLFRYLEENKYGTIIYKNGQMVKFMPNGRFDSRIVNSEKGSARRVSNGYVEFFEEFADTINGSEKTLEILRTLNEMKEEQIKFL